jgi:hypothetical protein
MPDPDFIVEKLLALRPDGTRCEVVVRVGKPFEDPPAKGTYACVVQCSGGGTPDDEDNEPTRACGEGPMQALHLGLWAVRARLERLEEDHGLRFVFPESGEPRNWRRFWYDDLCAYYAVERQGPPVNRSTPSDPPSPSIGGAE